ncbi:protein downstream neighbor of son homolog [Lytechinus pictus]|uniref:protein downstream neighbor of son homolog n=1 Tax=Lytechinus pictus TaxID=7653 RepID=UPI0030BA12AF
MENSPSKQWTKPSHVMKVRMKRNRRSTSDLTSKSLMSDQSLVNAGSHSARPGEGRSGKRRNPFGSGGGSNIMRRRIQSEVIGGQKELDAKEHGRNHQKLFTALDSQQDEVFDVEACQRLTKAIKAIQAEEEKKLPKSSKEPTEKTLIESLARGKPDLSPDWCLRTRVRFTSQSSFSWCQPIRMKEEARGLCSFVQGDNGPDTEEEKPVDESSWRSDLQQATMCWMHPDLPWLSLFPRIVPEPKKFKQSIATKEPAIATALMTNWSESFRSVFHLLRSGHCPYFYLCTHHFTVLFRAAGVGATPTMHALMTPTTRGLREALKTEGISYSMPLHQEVPSPPQSKPTTSTADQQSKLEGESCPDGETDELSEPNHEEGQIKEEPTEEEEEEEEDILRSPTKASSWLQSIGLDKTNFPSLEPTRVKFQSDQLLKLDNRPQSLVLVEGLDTQALYNFLLNSRTVLTSVGPLADIPPTILSPLPFKGATLHSCKLKSGTLKQQTNQSLVELSSLEVTGPIMPHNIHILCNLLRRTQDGAFQMALSNHEATSPFTSCSHSMNEKGGTDTRDNEKLNALRMNCGLSKSQAEYLTSMCTVNLPGKEVLCKDGLFL